jgi:hypothetical protein
MAFKHTLALAVDGSVYAFGKGPGLGIGQRGEGEEAAATALAQQRIHLRCMVPR